MRLYNTMTRVLDTFEPGPIVTLYVCGVTPYDTTHLGHAFSYSTFDVLIRLLHALGHEVRYTQNVTDIDDDILRKARELDVDWAWLGRDQTAKFERDMADLNMLPPTHYPRATDEIPGMIATIRRLLESGHAYRVDGNVYFSSNSVADFGALARLDRKQMLERFEETGDPPTDPRKRDPIDFVLWKESGPGEPVWQTPWGAGRPGWHIECSTMAVHYLGPRIDIHGGGDDLIFPHHSCEIVQSEAATGEAPFVRIWMHNAAVKLGGIKMSKSLGNLVMARTLLERFPAGAIRLYLHRHHYRRPFEYDEQRLEDEARLYERMATFAQSGEPGIEPAERSEVRDVRRRVYTALADDLDTPLAIDALATLLESTDPAAPAVLREAAGLIGVQFPH
jgi:L-cysteine:1D-myo-inositol 2-amino-2-deoxy-alpha-D-glucopyranoside ligase